jgi:hypothetical protein
MQQPQFLMHVTVVWLAGDLGWTSWTRIGLSLTGASTMISGHCSSPGFPMDLRQFGSQGIRESLKPKILLFLGEV